MTAAEFEAWDRARLEDEEEAAEQQMLDEWAEEEAEELLNIWLGLSASWSGKGRKSVCPRLIPSYGLSSLRSCRL